MKKLILICFAALLLSAETVEQKDYLVYNNFADANNKQEYITYLCKLQGIFDSHTERLCYVQKNHDSTLFNIVYDIQRTKGIGYDFNDYKNAISRDSLLKLDSTWTNILN